MREGEGETERERESQRERERERVSQASVSARGMLLDVSARYNSRVGHLHFTIYLYCSQGKTVEAKLPWCGEVARLVERRTGMLPTQV